MPEVEFFKYNSLRLRQVEGTESLTEHARRAICPKQHPQFLSGEGDLLYPSLDFWGVSPNSTLLVAIFLEDSTGALHQWQAEGILEARRSRQGGNVAVFKLTWMDDRPPFATQGETFDIDEDTLKDIEQKQYRFFNLDAKQSVYYLGPCR